MILAYVIAADSKYSATSIIMRNIQAGQVYPLFMDVDIKSHPIIRLVDYKLEGKRGIKACFPSYSHLILSKALTGTFYS